jgi:hypothetical protein
MTERRDIFGDTRGAALVLGIAMAAFVAFFLWQLMSVADAVIYRERMQEAADSTAFESAVMHARTMNLLSALNIFMAAVLSIMVMMRLIEMILGIAIAILYALSIVPFLAWLSGPAATLTNFEARILSKEPTVIRNVTRWLTRLNKAERTISSVAPLVDVTGTSTRP